MPLVELGKVVADRFVTVADAAPIPADIPVVVSGARYLAEATDLAHRTAAIGVTWPNTRKIDELAPYLDHIALVALAFPTFRDGRAYSQARILRERHGFRGELRATGDVLRDQFLFLHRAGFDTFEVAKDSDAAAFAQAVTRYSVFYQPTGQTDVSVLRRRSARITPVHAPSPYVVAR